MLRRRNVVSLVDFHLLTWRRNVAANVSPASCVQLQISQKTPSSPTIHKNSKNQILGYNALI